METKQFLTKYWYLAAGATGILSGFAVLVILKIFGDSLFTTSGAIFGIVSSIYFYYFLSHRPTIWRLSIWVVAAFLSFATAVWAIFFVSETLKLNNLYFSFGAAGLIGVLFLVIAFHFLFLRLRWYYIASMFLVGTIIPIAELLIRGTSNPSVSPLLYFFLANNSDDYSCAQNSPLNTRELFPGVIITENIK